MDILILLNSINTTLGIPATLLFLAVAIILTIKTNFIQVRALPRFFYLLKQQGINKSHGKTISPLQALFTAMATTIGIGNIVGPSLAIIVGGPGALFWIVVYAFFAAVTKFTEVTFAVETRIKDADGTIIGGPMQYLRVVHPYIANWYGYVMMILFACWSGTQANTLAGILAKEQIAPVYTGAFLACIALWVLIGGAHRIGSLASKVVPGMFVAYLVFALSILFKDLTALSDALWLVLHSVFTPAAAVGGFVGASVVDAMRSGVYNSVYITEAGVGTASIAHALADTKHPSDQGILAMYSIFAEIFLCTLSGLLVLVTGVWQGGEFSNTLMYEVFKMHSPIVGRYLLVMSIGLFALTTVIGNSFNGSQIFSSFFGHKRVKRYYLFVALLIFAGAQMRVPLVWALMNCILTFVVVPNLIGLLVLSVKKARVMKIEK